MVASLPRASLWHLDGDNGSTSFPDEGGQPLFAGSSDNARISTAHSRFGGASVLLNGISHYLFAEGSEAWRMGVEDFTLECFVRPRAPVVARQDLIACFSIYGYGVHIVAGGFLQAFVANAGATTIVGPGTTLVTHAVWHHVAFVRDGATLRLFLDGVSQATMPVTGVAEPQGLARLVIGRDLGASDRFFDGNIDEIRVTKGLARYTADFSPPTEPFTFEPAPLVMRDCWAGAGGLPAASFQGAIASFGSRLYRNFLILGAEARLVGTVKEKHTPDNTPLRCRVRLIRERDGATVGETWSDAATGAYAFTNIDSAEAYTVIAHDHAHNYRAVVADNLTVAGGGVELVE